MGQYWPLFVYFCNFHSPITNEVYINHRCYARESNPGMVGADGATELLPIFQAKTGVRIDDR